MKSEQQKTRNEIIINMDKQGHSQYAIAKAVGVDQSRISQLLNAYRKNPDTFFDNHYQGKPPKRLYAKLSGFRRFAIWKNYQYLQQLLS
jgi:transposase